MKGSIFDLPRATTMPQSKTALPAPNFDFFWIGSKPTRPYYFNLKVATYFKATEAFIEVQSRAEFGLVNPALYASIRKLLYDYLVLLGQFETQFLTNPVFKIHVLNLHILPASCTMFQIYSLAQDISQRNALLND